MLVRPQGQAEPLDKTMGSTLYATPELFQHILASHGVVIDDKNKTLTITSSSVNKNLQYDLSNEEVSKLMAKNFKDTGKQSNKGKNVVSIDERLSIINKVIENDFAGKSLGRCSTPRTMLISSSSLRQRRRSLSLKMQ